MRVPLRLFQGFGVELEYMIVREDTLDVLPVSDEVIKAVSGEYASDVEADGFDWSNELVLHVLEFKTAGPQPALAPLTPGFQEQVRRVQEILTPLGGRLLPTAMHPWMDPERETRLWPHEYNVVYATYDRIFGCKGHGWANLQSTHLNLPFGDDEEFGRLHAAIRLVLPLIAALAASSPIVEGRVTGLLDTRLEVYRTNQKRVANIIGGVIPERAYTRQEYHEKILSPMYEAIAPYDTKNVIRQEWLNSRGAIARFSRQAIEIRVIDIQECPAADIAILSLLNATLQALVQEVWGSFSVQKEWEVAPLFDLFLRSLRDGEEAVMEDSAFLRLFGVKKPAPCSFGVFWLGILDSLVARYPAILEPVIPELEVILREGPLSRRILRALPKQVKRADVEAVYRDLSGCLLSGELFRP